MSEDDASRPALARAIRQWSVPILLVWVVLAALSNIAVPNLEDVAKAHNVSLNTPDAPSFKAMQHIGKVFHEFDSDSSAMIVLEGDKPLGDSAHQYYNAVVSKLKRDTKHVEHVQDFWGDPLTAAGSQSKDGRAAYVQVYLAGNQGDALGNESVDAIRSAVAHTSAPTGVKAYVTGAAPLVTDQFEVGSKGIFKVTVTTVLVILAMLLWVYRSVTAILVLVTVIFEMAAARGIVALLGNVGLIGLSTYATNLLTLLVIAAGTDYAIFFVGRYHEARHDGRGSRNRVLHHVPRDDSCGVGFGVDGGRGRAMPSVHPTELFSEPWHSRRDRHWNRVGGRAELGSRGDHRRQFVRAVRP